MATLFLEKLKLVRLIYATRKTGSTVELTSFATRFAHCELHGAVIPQKLTIHVIWRKFKYSYYLVLGLKQLINEENKSAVT